MSPLQQLFVAEAADGQAAAGSRTCSILEAFTLEQEATSAYVLRIGVQAGLLPFEGKLQGNLRRLMDRPAAQAARFFEGLQ